MNEEKKVLLEITNLRKYFAVKGSIFRRRRYVQAVEDVSFSVYKGETLGLVGESGCGKTTLGRTIIRLYEPTSGRIVYDGTPIYDSEQKIAVDMLPYRRKMQIIFQDPSASLDPRMTVGEIVGEALDIHKLCPGKAERRERINQLLDEDERERLIPIEGTPIDLLNPPKGCNFGPRCKNCMKICLREKPPFTEVGEGHISACWLHLKEAVGKEGSSDA